MTGDPQVEQLVFECLERFADGGQDAVDALLCGHGPDVAKQVRETLGVLQRVGLCGEPAEDASGPEQVGPYRLFERLGAGSMGVVCRAQRTDDPTCSLAIKLMQPGLAQSRGSRLRFQREIAALRELDHPGICPVLDDGQLDGVPFLVMPFVPGVSLREKFAAAEFVGGRDANLHLLDVLQRLAGALHHAHERGFVHRDVKPGNVIVRPDGGPVLLDFGLARLERDGAASGLTMSGGAVGTPAYMAPEQVAGQPDVDRRADVYALGVMLFEGLTGKLPFAAPTRESLYRLILTGEPLRPSQVRPGVPSAFDVVVMAALARDRERRYQSAAAFAADLERLRRGQPPLARLPGIWQRTVSWTRRHPLPAALLGMLFVAVVGIAWLAAAIHARAAADRARTMAAQATREFVRDPVAALRLGLAAWDVAPVPEALEAIQAALSMERPAQVIATDGHAVQQLEFAGGDRHLLVLSANGSVRRCPVGDGSTGEPLTVPFAAGVLAVAPGDGAHCAVGGQLDGQIAGCTVEPWRVAWTATAWPDPQPVRWLGYSPDGRHLCCIGNDQVVLFDVDGTRLGELRAEHSIETACWLGAGRIVLAERVDAVHRLVSWQWDGRGWRRGPVRDAGVVSVLSAAPDGRLVLVRGAARTAATWSPDTDEWRTLDAQFGGDLVAGGISRDGDVMLVAAGGRLAVFSRDGGVRHGKAQDDVRMARGNAGGDRFATVGNLGLVSICVYEGRASHVLGLQRVRPSVLAMSHDGLQLAASSWQDEVVRWQLYDPRLPVFRSGDDVYSVVFGDAGEVVTGSARPRNKSGALSVWDLSTGQLRNAAEAEADFQIVNLAHSRDRRRWLALQSSDGRRMARVLERSGDRLQEVAVLPEGLILGYALRGGFAADDIAAFTDTEGALVLWHFMTGRTQRLIAPDEPACRWISVAVEPDRRQAWVGTAAGHVHRFDGDAEGTFALAMTLRIGESVQAIAPLPDGGLLVAANNGLLTRLHPDGGRQVLSAHTWRVVSLGIGQCDGELWFASGDTDGGIHLWRNGRHERRIIAHSGVVRSLQFSADCRQLLSGSGDGTTCVWPVRREDLLALAREVEATSR